MFGCRGWLLCAAKKDIIPESGECANKIYAGRIGDFGFRIADLTPTAAISNQL
jgi:hypothetical protein